MVLFRNVMPQNLRINVTVWVVLKLNLAWCCARTRI